MTNYEVEKAESLLTRFFFSSKCIRCTTNKQKKQQKNVQIF